MEEEARKLEEGLVTNTTLVKAEKKGEIISHVHNKEAINKGDPGDAIDSHDQNDEKNAKVAEEQPLVQQKSKRVATLDAFRGLTIVVFVIR